MMCSNLYFPILLPGSCVKADGEKSNTKMAVISIGVVERKSGHT